MSHTLGPWKVDAVGTYARRKVTIVADHDYPVAKIPTFYPTGEHMDLEQRSNAALIAAAPDLLAALEEIAEGDGCNCRVGPGCDMKCKDIARAAIAKAKGAA